MPILVDTGEVEHLRRRERRVEALVLRYYPPVICTHVVGEYLFGQAHAKVSAAAFQEAREFLDSFEILSPSADTAAIYGRLRAHSWPMVCKYLTRITGSRRMRSKTGYRWSRPTGIFNTFQTWLHTICPPSDNRAKRQVQLRQIAEAVAYLPGGYAPVPPTLNLPSNVLVRREKTCFVISVGVNSVRRLDTAFRRSERVSEADKVRESVDEVDIVGSWPDAVGFEEIPDQRPGGAEAPFLGLCVGKARLNRGDGRMDHDMRKVALGGPVDGDGRA